MAKANTNTAGTKPDATDATTIGDVGQSGAATGGDATGALEGAAQGGAPDGGAADQGGTVAINTAADGAGTPPGAGDSANALDTAISDVKEGVTDLVPGAPLQTLREAVGAAAVDAAKAGDHATHGVLNAIELKLSELRNTIVASEGQVAEEYRHVLGWFENLL